MTQKAMQSSPVEFAKALADDTRQKIMAFCCCEERSVGEIVEHVGMTQPTISHHLAILRDAGLVHIRHEGKQTFYSLNQESVVSCCGRLMQVFAPGTEVAQVIKTNLDS